MYFGPPQDLHYSAKRIIIDEPCRLQQKSPGVAVTGAGRAQPIRDLSVGFAGGLVALVAAVIARAASDTVLLAQIAVDAVSFIMPATWFSYLLDKLEGDAKPLLYGVLLAAQLLAYALIAVGAAAVSRRVSARYRLHRTPRSSRSTRVRKAGISFRSS